MLDGVGPFDRYIRMRPSAARLQPDKADQLVIMIGKQVDIYVNLEENGNSPAFVSYTVSRNATQVNLFISTVA